MTVPIVFIPGSVRKDWLKQRIRLHNDKGWDPTNLRWFEKNYPNLLEQVGYEQLTNHPIPPNQLKQTNNGTTQPNDPANYIDRTGS